MPISPFPAVNTTVRTPASFNRARQNHMVEGMQHDLLSTNGQHRRLTSGDQHLQQEFVRRDVTHYASLWKTAGFQVLTPSPRIRSEHITTATIRMRTQGNSNTKEERRERILKFLTFDRVSQILRT